VRYKLVNPLLGMLPPAYATGQAAGIDLRACIEAEELAFAPGERHPVPSGLAIEPLDHGVAGFVFSRSGLGAREGLTVSQGVGVIDPDYRGEIVVWLTNTSSETRVIRQGERVAQLVFLPIFRAVLEQAGELGATGRGSGGFGHTGST
jgi:dUTP pyrophosphatase